MVMGFAREPFKFGSFACGATVISTSLRSSRRLFLSSSSAPVDFPETFSRSNVIGEDVSPISLS
jgi:hypothetical protein